MKKIMTVVIALALLAAGYNNNVFAQTPPTGGGGGGGGVSNSVPDKVPLVSSNVLASYALTMVGQIGVQVYGPSVSGDNYRFVDYPYTDADPERMADVASAIELRFTTVVDHQLTSAVGYDSRLYKLPEPDGTTETIARFGLFNGVRNFKLEKGEAGWRVPAEAKKVELELGQVPWIVPGMREARITTPDGKGDYDFRQRQGDYWLDRGVIFLIEDMTALSGGELTLAMQDGRKVVYDLGDCYVKPTATVDATGFKPTIKGFRTVPDNTTDIVYQATDEIIRVAATIQLKVSVSFPPMLERYPDRVYVIGTKFLAADPSAKWPEFNPYFEPVKFEMGDGAVLIRFEYPPKKTVE